MTLLEVRGLVRVFGGVRAVDGVSLTVSQGEVLGLIGPNGAGKTTLFQLITGAERPDEGRVLLEGHDITRWPTWKRARAGLIRTFQHGRAFPNLSVEDNVKLGLHGGRSLTRLARESPEWDGLVAVHLAPFGERLTPRAHEPAWQFSYANRRRIELARALAAGPRVLLLDEPTAGMNPVETLEMLDVLQGLRARGQTMVVIEHKLPLILPLADRVVVLDHGSVLAEGNPLDVPRDPRVIEAYLGKRHG